MTSPARVAARHRHYPRRPSAQALGGTHCTLCSSRLPLNRIHPLVVGCGGHWQMHSCWGSCPPLPSSPPQARGGRPSLLMPVAPARTVAGHGGQCERFVGMHDPLDCPQARTLPPCHHVWSLRSRSLGQSQCPHGQGWLSLWPELVKHVCFLRGSLRLWAGDVLGPDYIFFFFS